MNPYDQHFCGEEFFQHELPIDPSQMTRWRKRIGEAGCERLLALTIEAGKRTGTVTERSFERVIVDTTVQPKAVQHPTDARLYRKIHRAMLRIAEAEGLRLRQSYRRLMDRAFQKHGGHAKAKQFRRARRVLRSLKAMAGRVMRDVERKLDDAAYARHKGTQLQHRFPVGLLEILELPLVLLLHLEGFRPKRVLHPALAIVHPALDFRGRQIERPAGLRHCNDPAKAAQGCWLSR